MKKLILLFLLTFFVAQTYVYAQNSTVIFSKLFEEELKKTNEISLVGMILGRIEYKPGIIARSYEMTKDQGYNYALLLTQSILIGKSSEFEISSSVINLIVVPDGFISIRWHKDRNKWFVNFLPITSMWSKENYRIFTLRPK